MIKIMVLALVASPMLAQPTRSWADDPCNESRKKILAFTKAIDLTPANKKAGTGHFTVKRVPSNPNIASERFEIRYLIDRKVIWDLTESPSDDGDLEIRAAAKRLVFDFNYGAGGSVQCHYIVSVNSDESIYRQIK